MTNSVVYPVSSERISTITDIVSSVTMIRSTLLEARSLLLWDDKQSPFDGFFYTNAELYKKLLKRMHREIIHPAGRKLIPLLSEHLGIVVNRTASDPRAIPFLNEDKTLSFYSPYYSKKGSDLLFFDAVPLNHSRNGLYMSTNNEYFNDIHDPVLTKRHQYGNRYETEPWLYLSGMHSLFMVFTTGSVDSVDLEIESRRRWRLGKIYRSQYRGDPIEDATLHAIREAVYKMRDIFLSKDDGTLPKTKVHRDIVEQIVTADLNASPPGRDVNAKAMSAKLNTLKGSRAFESDFDEMNEACAVTDNMFSIYPALGPRFEWYIPATRDPLCKIRFAYGQQNGVISMDRYFFLDTLHKATWSDTITEDLRMPFILPALRLMELLKDADQQVLLYIKSNLADIERGALTFYRFMNATKNLCQIEILASRI